MKVVHTVLLASNPMDGKRMAYHIVHDNGSQTMDALQHIKMIYGKDVKVAVHNVVTNSETWNSVVKKDPFFKGVELFDYLFAFINTLRNNKALSAVDVARYILAKCPDMDLVKLQNTVVKCSFEYMFFHDKELFSKSYIWKNGETGYFASGVVAYWNLFNNVLKLKDNKFLDELHMRTKRRILNSDDGINRLGIIDTVLRKML